METKIIIDLGRVVINNERNKINLRDGTIPAIPRAINSIGYLVETFGVKDVFILSKDKKDREPLTRAWLEGKSFYSKTGFKRENLFFCREIEEKAPKAQELGATCIIDDNPEVLISMIKIESITHLFLFNPRKSALKEFPNLPEKIEIYYKWENLIKRFAQGYGKEFL